MRGQHVNRAEPAELVIHEEDGMTVLEPHGDWLVDTIGRQDAALRKVEEHTRADRIVIDFTHLGRVDTAGA